MLTLLITLQVPEGKKCLVVMGRNGHEQDGTSIRSICEAGVVKAYTDSEEGHSCEVKLQVRILFYLFYVLPSFLPFSLSLSLSFSDTT